MSAKFIESNSEAIFHLPYYAAQTAIGEDDGGMASLFEDDGQGYNSGFANAGGALVIEKLLAYETPDAVLEGVATMPTPQMEQRFETSEHMLRSSIEEIAEDVTTKWHDALKSAFPAVPAAEIDSAFDESKSAVSAYLGFQYAYSIEAEQSKNQSPKP